MAFVRSRLNMFRSYVSLTHLKCSQVEKGEFMCSYTEQIDLMEHNSEFSCIHSPGKRFQMFFKNTFWTIVLWTIVPFLFKLSFFERFFASDVFAWTLSSKNRVARALRLAENHTKSGRTDGRTPKFKRVPHKSPSGKYLLSSENNWYSSSKLDSFRKFSKNP